MYLRFTRRLKDGKEHRYWSIVESKRCAGGKVVQRPVLYLGEINDSQRDAWCRVIEAFDEDRRHYRQLALFPAERAVPDRAKTYGVQVRLDEMQLHRPRQWGACFLACHLYGQLELDLFFAARLPNSREGTRWQHILQTLVCYRLIDPGSEWRLHRQWFEQSAMGDLIGADYSLVEKNALYRCLDKLLEHKDALFLHLRQRWQDLFAASFDVLLYDLTSTYFEFDPPSDDEDKRRFGYATEHGQPITDAQADHDIDKAVALGELDAEGPVLHVEGTREELVATVMQTGEKFGIPMDRAEAERLADKALQRRFPGPVYRLKRCGRVLGRAPIFALGEFTTCGETFVAGLPFASPIDHIVKLPLMLSCWTGCRAHRCFPRRP